MMRRALRCLIAALGTTVLAGCGGEKAQETTVQQTAANFYLSPPSDAPIGRQLFFEKCEMCHDASGMGTGLLARRIEPAELLEREDLTAEYVLVAVRQGIGNMPAMPRGELSDEELEAIASFLAKGSAS